MYKELPAYLCTAVPLLIAGLFATLSGFNKPHPDEPSVNPIAYASLSGMDNTEKPVVKILSPADGTVLQKGSRFRYQIEINDPERTVPVPPIEILFSVDFLPENTEPETFLRDRKSEQRGLSLIREQSCFSCHADKSKMLGPSFEELADRYGNHAAAAGILSESIKNGTSQKWDGYEMPAFPGLSDEDLRSISEFILNQGSDKNRRIFTGSEGILSVSDLAGEIVSGHLIFTASYVNQKGQESTDTVVTEIE